jgi:hypothetical protein
MTYKPPYFWRKRASKGKRAFKGKRAEGKRAFKGFFSVL